MQRSSRHCFAIFPSSLEGVEELAATVPFPAKDFLSALAAADAPSEEADVSAGTTQSKRKLAANQATKLRSLMRKRLEGVFAKCVLPDGSSDDHIASDRPVDAERAAMAASLLACMSPEQIAEMIENTEKSHIDVAAAASRREARRRERRHSMDARIAV